MARQNPIADAMSTIKNAGDAGRSEVIVEPASKVLGAMLRVMQENSFIGGFEFIDDGRGGQFRVQLTGTINRCGAISHGLQWEWLIWNTGNHSTSPPQRTSVS